MNILLWVLQGILAVMMLMPGFMKLSNSREALKEKGKGRMDWVEDVSARNIKVIGILEVLAGIGIILPLLLGILPWLTPLAALGVILTMIGALLLHIRRGDGMQAIVPNIMILLIAAFVLYGRFALFSV